MVLSATVSHRSFWIGILTLLFAATLLLAQQGCGWDVTDESDDSSLQGVVTDLSGNPLAGARVTVAGQEADQLTDDQGQWQIADLDSTTVPGSPVTASLPGYQVLVSNVEEMERADSRLPEFEPDDQVEFIQIQSPEDGSVVNMPEPCTDPTVKVEGRLGGPYDIVILLDISASMNEAIPGLFWLRPIDIAKEALIAIMGEYDFDETQIGIITFYGGASILSYLTNDPVELINAIDGLAIHDDGTTNYERGIKTAVDLLETSGRQNAEKHIIMISDGYPTSHGYPKTNMESNVILQDQEDIDGALDAAFYSLQRNVEIHAIAIGDQASTHKLTTLPAIADITGGYYLILPDFFDMMELPTYLTTHQIDLLTVEDQAGNIYEIEVSADGAFSASIPVDVGPNTLVFTAYKGEEPNLNVFADKEITFVVSASQGEEGLIECHFAEGACKSTVWYLYVEYNGQAPADVDIFYGANRKFLKSQTLSDDDRRIFVDEDEVGKPMVPYITYKIDWDQDGVYDEETQIITTCAKPIGVGFTFGSLQLLGYGHGPKQEYYEGLFPY